MADVNQQRNSLNQVENYKPAKSSSTNVHVGSQITYAGEELRTPLPKFQLFLTFLIQFAEPITALVIYPFVNQFVRDTGITKGDVKKTGYYAGIVESVFFFAEAVTVFQWGWLSDRFGRRPILLLGPLGLTFAMLRFGYSITFWPMVLSRCMQGVAKTVMVELTDSTNVGDAFALMPLMWSIGSTVAPIIGGVLSNPATRWPNVFGRINLFREHPYFLPCLVAASIASFTFVIGFIGLKETHPSFSNPRDPANDKERKRDSKVNSTDTLLGHSDSINYGTTSTLPSTSSKHSIDSGKGLAGFNSEFVTLRSAFKSRRMQFIIVNYVFLAFTDMCYSALNPLILSTPIQSGGLGLNPYQIGLIMGIWGFINAFVQIKLLGRIIRRYGAPSVYRVAYACQLVCFMSFPFSTYFARRDGSVGFGSCAVIFIQLSSQFICYMAYGAIHVIVAQSAPKSIMGSINGLVQMTGCTMRTIAPAFASSLFSISMEKQILGGYFIYVVIYCIVLVGIGFSRHLTDQKLERSSA
ncbi:hypothetical protein Ac2012v2_002741 [Leucoagaricus gongylophorus]